MFRERKSFRLDNYDYSRSNLYFITSNIRHRKPFFGDIVDGQMKLSQWGKIALDQWLWIETRYSYITLHAHVIMPDHMHGILEIGKRATRIVDHHVDFLPVQPIKIKPLSELIGAYKTTVSKQIHLEGNCEFCWQRLYHDHIIRDSGSYQRITDYINNNPGNWKKNMLQGKLQG